MSGEPTPAFVPSAPPTGEVGSTAFPRPFASNGLGGGFASPAEEAWSAAGAAAQSPTALVFHAGQGLSCHWTGRLLSYTLQWTDNILVAKDGERVVGFVGYGTCRDDGLADYGEVFALYVLADYCGRGIGYALMNAALEKLPVSQKFAVWVLKGNERAIRFYKRYGFRFDGAEQEIMLGTPNTVLRMIYEKG